MITSGRDGAEDTGETDVRGLRRDLFGDAADLPEPDLRDTHTPHVGDRYDVPHEGALPDLYGSSEQDGSEDVDIEQYLLQMVDNGELCFGWDEELQEFTFWEPSHEPEQTAPEPAKHRLRRPRHLKYRKVMLAFAAALAAPFAVGLTASAVEGHLPHLPVLGTPDTTVDDLPSDTPATVAALPAGPVEPPAPATHPAKAPAPTAAKHAKPSPVAEGAKDYIGKHRRVTAPAASTPPKAVTPTPPKATTSPTVPVAAPPAPAPQQQHHDGHDGHHQHAHDGHDGHHHHHHHDGHDGHHHHHHHGHNSHDGQHCRHHSALGRLVGALAESDA